MSDDVDANLDKLAAAYGVDPPDVEGVVDEVVRHAVLSRSDEGHALAWGQNERDAVVDVVLAIVETPGIVPALAAGDALPEAFIIEAEARVWPDGRYQSMPALAMVDLVIEDLRRALGPVS
jgi:hypothetical protein